MKSVNMMTSMTMMSKLKIAGGLLLMLLVSVLPALAQEAPTPTAVDPTPASRLDAPAEYKLGPGDLLSVRVSGLREFEHSTRISNSGRIRVPYVGVMMAAGMTALEVEREVAKLIKERELVSEPSVRIYVEQHRAQPTYAVGELTTPGQFVINGEMYLLDLISRAGGLLATADATGFLYRRRPMAPDVQSKILTDEEVSRVSTAPGAALVPAKPGAAPAALTAKAEEVISIDLNALREGTKPELNFRLQGGDILYVPRRTPQNFFVIGEVKVPGAYTLPRRSQVTASQAIIYAGGPLPTAKASKGYLMRPDAQGVRQAKHVDFGAIMEGKQADFVIQPNDIIFIPKGTLATVKVGMTNLIPLLIQQFLIF